MCVCTSHCHVTEQIIIIEIRNGDDIFCLTDDDDDDSILNSSNQTTDQHTAAFQVKKANNVQMFFYISNRLRLLLPFGRSVCRSLSSAPSVCLLSACGLCNWCHTGSFVGCVTAFKNHLNDRGQAIMPMKLFEWSIVVFASLNGHCLHFWMKFKLSFVKKLI